MSFLHVCGAKECSFHRQEKQFIFIDNTHQQIESFEFGSTLADLTAFPLCGCERCVEH